MKGMSEMNFHRQLDILDPSKTKDVHVHVIGVGSVGSFTTLTLAKMGVSNFTVWDDDKIEPHNIPNQFYKLSDVEKPKTESLKRLVKEFTGVNIDMKNERVTEETTLKDNSGKNIVVVCTDSKESRRMVWKLIKNNPNFLLIDSRMGAELMKIYTINPADPTEQEFYEKTLIQNGMELACTARTIIYNILVLSGMISNQLKKYLMDDDLYKEIIFDLKTMIFLTK